MRKKILKKLTELSLVKYIEFKLLNMRRDLIKFMLIESLRRIIVFGDMELERAILEELTEEINAM